MKKIKSCLICGKEFLKPRDRGMKNWIRQKYCSPDCFHKARKHHTESKKCPICGKIFNREDVGNRSLKGWEKRIYCSNRCLYIGKRGKNNNLWGKRGPLCSRWKGGVMKQHELERRSPAYHEWRNNVFKRDYYTCKKCGSIKVKLRAHHIESFHNHPELSMSIENGITFCIDCHLNFHHMFGNENSRQQLDIYLQK